MLFMVSYGANSAELTHNFNSPAFSGIGYSSHVLTIYQLEQQQKEKNKAKQMLLKQKQTRTEANKPQNKFKSNLESKIYNEIATKVSQSLFNGTCSQDTGSCGNIANLGGNSVEWTVNRRHDYHTYYQFNRPQSGPSNDHACGNV
jgi:hypothetical protein